MSYIQVWSMDGKPLVAIDDDPSKNHYPSLPPGEKPSLSRRLIGHSGPVYSVAFSPSTVDTSAAKDHDTGPHYLLSCSADKTIRLWSVDAWACLTMYRAHNTPVWDVRWGPFGHYFMSCGMDRVARVWVTDKISPLRMFVGHDDDVDCGCFHPNGAYIFTAGDKTVRMWDISRGSAVRMFSGHTGNITTIECSPDGKTVASGDDQGSINLWDLTSGALKKRMRGHGKGGIWSLSWSVESRIIVSGGADMTVRVWDAAQKLADKTTDGAAKPDGTPGSSATAGPSTGGTQKKSKKDVVVTADQISVFPTKKSPVYKVLFTRSNLILSASAYMPHLH
jgi:transcription initiation factor TFIID subunit 5